MSPKANVVRAVRGADGEVRVTISWMASRSFNRWRGLLHDRILEIRYWNQTTIINVVPNANFPLDFRVWKCRHNGSWFNIGSASCNVPGWHAHPQFQPSYNCRTVPQSKRCSSFHSFRQQFMPEWKREICLALARKLEKKYFILSLDSTIKVFLTQRRCAGRSRCGRQWNSPFGIDVQTHAKRSDGISRTSLIVPTGQRRHGPTGWRETIFATLASLLLLAAEEFAQRRFNSFLLMLLRSLTLRLLLLLKLDRRRRRRLGSIRHTRRSLVQTDWS